MDKKAILVVSFGTTYAQGRKENIESVENKIKQSFPDYEVRRAFTSRFVIKKLAERDQIYVDTEEAALEKLAAENYQEVLVQPLHIVGGEEYEKIKQLIWLYRHSEQQVFPILRLGRPLLHYTGLNNMPDDYGKIIADWRAQLEPKDASEAVVIMGHGGVHPGNTAYAAFQMKLAEAGLDRTFIYTVEGFPSLAYVIKKLQAAKIQQVSLKPFLLTSGDHVHEDMAGEDESSTKNQLMNAGFSVSVSFAGLGSYETIQQLYVEHVQDMIDCAAHCRLR